MMAWPVAHSGTEWRFRMGQSGFEEVLRLLAGCDPILCGGVRREFWLTSIFPPRSLRINVSCVGVA